ncbi:MAG: 5'-nucleotidase C-terminal domain-containing protein, partial [Bifidobacteriaceae bacterium]|nr:5'-nucleotidase C-terminal domain-containing protein [Bifidobacteriaceae bacterium]
IKDVYSCDMKQPSENRGDESSVGRMVANSYKDYVSAQLKRHIDIGVTQPGSLRTDAIPNSDGKLTYGNAVSISPFANELFISELTGAQLKQILEEQWQVDSQGQRPSRPFLGLSFSAGFTYTVDTWDPNAEPGNHVLSMWVNGKPVENDKIYTVIETSFLQAGGDNFRGFTVGKHSDSGFIDSDALINYAKDKGLNYNFQSDYARSSAIVKNQLSESIKAGSVFSQTIANLNIYSDGAPQNKTGEVYLLENNLEKKIGAFKVNNGQSDISAKIPDNISSGNYIIKYIAHPSNTTIYQNISIISDNYPNPFYPDTGLPFKEILFVFIILLISASVCKKASKF